MEALIKSVVGFVMAVMAIAGVLTQFYWIGILCGLGGTAFGVWSLVDVLGSRKSLPAVRQRQEPVLDFSAKQKRREAEVSEWTMAFFDSLGQERGKVLTAEWKSGSPRQVLADQLVRDVALAERLGKKGTQMRLEGLRWEITAHPDVKLSTHGLEWVRTERDRLVRGLEEGARR